MAKTKRDINQQDFKIVDLYFSNLIICIHLKLWIASARQNFNTVQVGENSIFYSVEGLNLLKDLKHAISRSLSNPIIQVDKLSNFPK